METLTLKEKIQYNLFLIINNLIFIAVLIFFIFCILLLIIYPIFLLNSHPDNNAQDQLKANELLKDIIIVLLYFYFMTIMMKIIVGLINRFKDGNNILTGQDFIEIDINENEYLKSVINRFDKKGRLKKIIITGDYGMIQLEPVSKTLYMDIVWILLSTEKEFVEVIAHEMAHLNKRSICDLFLYNIYTVFNISTLWMKAKGIVSKTTFIIISHLLARQIKKNLKAIKYFLHKNEIKADEEVSKSLPQKDSIDSFAKIEAIRYYFNTYPQEIDKKTFDFIIHSLQKNYNLNKDLGYNLLEFYLSNRSSRIKDRIEKMGYNLDKIFQLYESEDDLNFVYPKLDNFTEKISGLINDQTLTFINNKRKEEKNAGLFTTA